MPRPNPPRSLKEEANLARRVAYERERKGWSYDGLARRMTDVGCPINQSALYKIEKAEPPRRITVAELVAFSSVFDVPMDELVLPPELLGKRALAELLIAWHDLRGRQGRAEAETRDAWSALREYVDTHPELDETLHELVGIWMGYDFPTADQVEATAYWMWKLTDSDEWKARALAGIGAEGGAARGKPDKTRKSR